MTQYQLIQETTEFIKNTITNLPQYGIILGTGLGALVNDIEIETEINYEDIPHFPVSTVEFHKGRLIFGTLARKQVVVMQGRFHYYEGYNMQEVTFPVRIMKLLGIEKLFISNAAGALNPSFKKSDLMIIEDHINFQTENPLVGKNIDEMGTRFPDMSEPYDKTLVEQAIQMKDDIEVGLHKGVYVAVNGPNLETRAEYRMLRTIGADAVGMSTVPENIVARQMLLPVFAISVLTDLCYPGHIEKVKIEDIIAAAVKAEPSMTKIIKQLISLS